MYIIFFFVNVGYKLIAFFTKTAYTCIAMYQLIGYYNIYIGHMPIYKYLLYRYVFRLIYIKKNQLINPFYRNNWKKFTRNH